ncbi:hypothetical protein CgunFtcFv8_022395 [Champsocephalus gunnari]|uniref:Protrudin n=1 Tax=Champsocephalus gunnari TaxID=52237 RepID=A0AAN8HT45_CHAGU|nr:hypothetical protein CgunFtcFv8_022395 [Champsocephalus gunnari]
MKPQLAGAKKRLKAAGSEAALSLQQELVAAIHGAFEVAVEIAVREVTKLVSEATGDAYVEIQRENESLKQRLQRAEAKLEERGGSSPRTKQHLNATSRTDQPPHLKCNQKSSNPNVDIVFSGTGVKDHVPVVGQTHSRVHQLPDPQSTHEEQRSGDSNTQHFSEAASERADDGGAVACLLAFTEEVSDEISRLVRVESINQPCREQTAHYSPLFPSVDEESSLDNVTIKKEILEEGGDDSAFCLDSMKVEDFSPDCMSAIQAEMLVECKPEVLEGQIDESNAPLSCTRLAQELPNIFPLAEPAPIPEAPPQGYVHRRNSRNLGHSATNLYACKSCGQSFPLPSLLRRHHSQCQQRIQHCYPPFRLSSAAASQAAVGHSTMQGVSQDPSRGAGEGGEMAHTLSKETPGSPDASELGSPRCTQNFDLLNMVVSYKRMALFLEPAADAVEVTRFLLGWKMPLCSLFVCLFLNVFFCTITEVGWITVGVVSVALPAALGYLQDRCGGRASDSELHKMRYHAVHRRDLQTVHLTKQEAMLEVKDLLKHLDDMLSSACLSAETFYRVLYWDDHITSSRFYGAMLVLACLLYVAPLGWVFAGLNSATFLWNRDFCRVLLDLRKLLHMGQASEGKCEEQEHGHLLDQTPTPTSLEDLSPGSVEEAEEAEPDDEFKDAIEEHSVHLQEDDDGPLGAPEYDTISENGLLSRNEPIRSKVSKLTEKLRKRYPTACTGNCSSCNAVFSVLKKRRSCSNCGNSFCSRCCSFKVLRSCMGATAPEAQRETVFVCAACNSSLIKLQ